MARKKRQPFPTDNFESDRIYEGEPQSGLLGFFRDHGVRETIESIVVAVMLALMFRAFEAEAFIIPTGSMAPTLQGEHYDVDCKMCGHDYRTGNSHSNSTIPPNLRDNVSHTYCPICRFRMQMQPNREPDHESYSGDRILVNKFVYDFSEPKRFDVIVFKNPNNGKQNFIKRLVGLPGDNLLVDNGDLFQLNEDGSTEIIRKTAGKLPAMLQLVDDTQHVAQTLKDADWPSKWQQWGSGEDSKWSEKYIDGRSEFSIGAEESTNWLRFRNIIPRSYRYVYTNPGRAPRIEEGDWEEILSGDLPEDRNWLGSLIGDYYCYNHAEYKNQKNRPEYSPGLHWVGDLAVRADVEIKSSSGVIALDLVEAGAHFTCWINVENGEVSIGCGDRDVQLLDENGKTVDEIKGTCDIKGAGTYEIMFANADDQLFLYVNGDSVELPLSGYTRNDPMRPQYPQPVAGADGQRDAGDAEPAGFTARNCEVRLTRIQILRDVYYSAVKGDDSLSGGLLSNERAVDDRKVEKVFNDPRLWNTPDATEVFVNWKERRSPVVFQLTEDQFLPMGDNSPRSKDGRIWDGPKNLPRELLIGRAMVVYWPHLSAKPFKYLPNFEDMGFIK